jgi:hypothetical protein
LWGEKGEVLVRADGVLLIEAHQLLCKSIAVTADNDKALQPAASNV